MFREQLLLDLKSLIEINTNSYNKKNINEGFKILENIALSNGLYFCKLNSELAVISKKHFSEIKKYNFILTHIDCVDVNLNNWIYDPYTLTRNGDYIYGRGVIDNKGSLITSLYALKEIENLRNDWCLFVGSNEEISMNDMYKYFKDNKDYMIGFTPDGYFDVSCGEPHIITFDLKFNNTNSDFVNGGTNYNTIMGDVTSNGVTFTGKSSHIKDYNDGDNAIYKINNLMNTNLQRFLIDHCTLKIPTISDDSLYSYFNIGMVSSDNSDIILKIDLRLHPNFNLDGELEKYFKYITNEYDCEYTLGIKIAGVNNSSNKYFKDLFKNKRSYFSIGGTYSRCLDNCFVIGPQSFENHYNGPHQDNESVNVNELISWVKIYKEWILKFDSLK